MDDLVTGVVAGFVVAAVVSGIVAYALTRRQAHRHVAEVQRYEASIDDLRQERAEDKETNRRLRHELVAQSPGRLVDAANSAELERDSAVSERDQAVEQLALVEEDLAQAHRRLADREAKLREYRQALKEIRMSLEAQDRTRTSAATDRLIAGDTGELPAGVGGAASDGDMPSPEALAADALARQRLDAIDLDPAPEVEPADLSAGD